MDSANYRLAKWIGRGQAFAMTASHSLLAQAKCWKEIHDSAAYKISGLSWEEFCPAELGLSRPNVDSLIDSLEEFGDTYCQLSEIVRISPATYRAISSKIEDGAIEIEGELIPIAVENAAVIRREVHRMRSALQRKRPAQEPLTALPRRLEGSVSALCRLGEGALEAAQKETLR